VHGGHSAGKSAIRRRDLATQNHTPKGAPFYIASVKEECLAKLVLLGESSLRRALRHYEAHYHEERNHQGKDNVLLFPLPTQAVRGEQEKVRCRERLGGLLKYYEREAA
jgi:putative transposase